MVTHHARRRIALHRQAAAHSFQEKTRHEAGWVGSGLRLKSCNATAAQEETAQAQESKRGGGRFGDCAIEVEERRGSVTVAVGASIRGQQGGVGVEVVAIVAEPGDVAGRVSRVVTVGIIIGSSDTEEVVSHDGCASARGKEDGRRQFGISEAAVGADAVKNADGARADGDVSNFDAGVVSTEHEEARRMRVDQAVAERIEYAKVSDGDAVAANAEIIADPQTRKVAAIDIRADSGERDDGARLRDGGAHARLLRDARDRRARRARGGGDHHRHQQREEFDGSRQMPNIVMLFHLESPEKKGGGDPRTLFPLGSGGESLLKAQASCKS